jgi:hypothetical protein
MAVACAVEERNCKQAEMELAARRCRQHILAARHQALLAARLNMNIGPLGDEIRVMVKSAVERERSSMLRCPPEFTAPSAPEASMYFAKSVPTVYADLPVYSKI